MPAGLPRLAQPANGVFVQIAALVIVILNLVLLGLLARKLLVLDSAQRALRIELAQLTPADALPPTLDRAFAAGRNRLITVEILNPLELAGAHSRLAGLAGSVAPGPVRALVYEQAAKIAKVELAKQNVEADVQVYVAD
jgi:hypothetical protein